MNVTLEIVDGPQLGRRVTLRQGQVATFGRTEWADFSFPEDAELDDVHFAIECRATGCSVRDLDSRSGVQHNAQPVGSADCQPGDKISAGKTTFAVAIEGKHPAGSSATPVPMDQASPADASVSEAPAPAAAPQDERIASAELCRGIDFEETESTQLVTQYADPEELVRVLIDREYLVDAVRVAAQWLPKREAVWWGRVCVADAFADRLTEENTAALDCAATWVADPTEEHRRAAERAATALEFETPAAWVAAGAFWSGGSLTPPGTQEVPPARTLTGVAIAAAVTLAANESQADTDDKYREFLGWSQKIEKGELHW
jgi:pSer/pThr/pTyr-binding forkhead associated (FHA) protein